MLQVIFLKPDPQTSIKFCAILVSIIETMLKLNMLRLDDQFAKEKN